MRATLCRMLFCVLVLLCCAAPTNAEPVTWVIEAGAAGKAISPDLFGIFFEDLNYAADGGLYAELVQNRSFEYSPADARGWHSLTAWNLVEKDGGKGAVVVDAAQPLNLNNPHYAVLGVANASGTVGIVNTGYDGIVVQAGGNYPVSLFARQVAGPGGSLVVRLLDKEGKTLAETTLPQPTSSWQKYEGQLSVSQDATDARLLVASTGEGRVALDMISLFPPQTFKNRPNGLRADLAQVIADLKPKFMRFPGGCLVHGDGLDNMYRWQDSIGPVHERRVQRNIWHYHQSLGLGYFEYFQSCEDIGAKPVPVVPAGVCCQNAGASVTGKWGQGQRGLAPEDMPAYVQEVLDLVEYANGPADSKWGARRAAAGHPEPFHLEYLGIGNEDRITPTFRERFEILNQAVRTKYPEITVIGTVGPFFEGEDFDNGWQIASELHLPMVDEHYYVKPSWFLENLHRYDSYDRQKSHVYLGEYAAHEDNRQTTLRSALAEAAYMTSLERNGDVVRMASFAPLLGKVGHTQWNPDLIYFSNTRVQPTINYYVQQLFGTNGGDEYLANSLGETKAGSGLAVSAVRDSRSGDILLKLVNPSATGQSLRVELQGLADMAPKAASAVLAGDPMAVNRFDNPQPLVPQATELSVGPSFAYEVPAYSLTVIRIEPAK